ncbi:MAG: transketolase [Bacteroidetes bacterium]|nr:transketolase [Bacteroidota bacterium]
MSQTKAASINAIKIRDLETMANRLRRHSLISTAAAGSGHPTSCLSCAEIMAVLFFHVMHYDFNEPRSKHNDRFILSKGHAAPIYWGVLVEAGILEEKELQKLRHIDSELEGHPTPRSPFIDVASGSLGQGLSAGLGMAIASGLEGIDNHIYVLMGDGEMAEGAVWEAAALASHRELDNLIAIADINRLGQSGETMLAHHLEIYQERFEAFGWHTIIVDGHDVPALVEAYEQAQHHRGGPSILLAKTLKGKGVSFLENQPGYHGKPVVEEQLDQALEEIGNELIFESSLFVKHPRQSGEIANPSITFTGNLDTPHYPSDAKIATRQAYGQAILELGGQIPQVVVLDAETKNSTYAEQFSLEFSDRFVEGFIAEQNMVGMAMGLSKLGKIPFVSTFGAFFSRAHDQIRMAGVSKANIKFVGSHVGVSIGEDGPSQMGLEDLGLFRAIPNSVVLYPSDAICAYRCVGLAAKRPGIVYIRTSRPATSLVYENDETFSIGGSKILRSSKQDQVTLIGAGVTLHQALQASDFLAQEHIYARVIDIYSVKPLDRFTLLQALTDTGHLMVIEDHYLAGGLGEAVALALAGETYKMTHLAITELPRSGSPQELMAYYGINSDNIIAEIKKMLAD